MPQNIAILHGSNDLYGASRVLASDAELLVALGHGVHVILPEEGPLTGMLRRVGADVSFEDLRVLRRVDGVGASLPPLRLPRGARGVDLLVTWTLALSTYLPTARLHRLPAVASVHEILEGRSGSALAWLTARSARFLMTNSGTTSAWVRSHGAIESRCRVAFPEAPTYDPLPLPPVGAPFTALLAGRVNGHKGHLEAVDAVKRVRERGVDVRLILAGGVYPGQERHLDELVESIAHLDGIRFVGEVSDIRPLLADAHVLLVPTVRPEPFGIVATEAWAAGRRVIGSSAGGLAEAIAMVEGLAVAPGDTGALADAIELVANSAELCSAPSATAQAAYLCTRDARREAWSDVLSALS